MINLTVNYKQARKYLSQVIMKGLVPFITSSPGVGKSAMVKDIAKEFNLKVVDIRLSMLEPSDINGLPNFTADGKAYFAPFDIFPLEGTPIPEGKDGWLVFCHHKDTEVLTRDLGFVKFSDLPKDALVAQYDMYTHAISYVLPEAYISYHKKGKLVYNRGDAIKYAITEDHDLIVQTKVRTNSNGKQLTYKRKPLETSISGDLQIPVAGYNENGRRDSLTYDEKLAIAFQADGSFTWEHIDGESCSISFGFTKECKIKQFRQDFPEAKEVISGDYTNFYFTKISKKLLSKRLRDVFTPSDFTVEGCKAFLEYVNLWDGFTAGTGKGYSSIILDNASVIQEFAILSGHACNISTQVDDRKDTFSDCHKVHWYPKDARTTQVLKSQTVEEYDDKVYCLKMPKGTLVTRYEGSVLISGNCDEFNSASKQVMAAAYKLILDKQVGNYNLHPNVAIICAGNRVQDRAITNTLSTAMQSRLIHLELEITFEEWLEVVGIPFKYDNRILAYLAQYPHKLNTFKPDHTDKTYACPRSWEFVNRLIEGENDISHMAPLLAGTISSDVAVEFIQFTKIFDQLPSIQQILADPLQAPFPNTVDAKWATLTVLLDKIDDDTIGAIITYSERFGMDLRVYFIRSFIHRYPALKSHKAVTKTLVALSRYINN